MFDHHKKSENKFIWQYYLWLGWKPIEIEQWDVIFSFSSLSHLFRALCEQSCLCK